MQAFHNDIKIKEKYVTRVKTHIELDNLVRGQGWENGKGCTVGCTLENYNHAQYPIELGIPEWLAKLEDTLFENMSIEKSKKWPLVFLESINIGADLEKVRAPFMIYILEQNLKYMDQCVFDKDENPNVVKVIEDSKKAVQQVIDLYRAENWNGEAVRSAAYSAYSAYSAAEPAARSAARSAESSAWSAAYSSLSAAFDCYADKLLEILRDCK